MSRNPLTAQNTSVLVQSRVLEARDAKVFGDMLTFYTFIFKFGTVRYKDVCLHILSRSCWCAQAGHQMSLC